MKPPPYLVPMCECEHGISWHGPEHVSFFGIRFKVARPCHYDQVIGVGRKERRVRCFCDDYKFEKTSRDILSVDFDFSEKV